MTIATVSHNKWPGANKDLPSIPTTTPPFREFDHSAIPYIFLLFFLGGRSEFFLEPTQKQVDIDRIG